jgi:endonuclease/exonuclease/phosphatase family metal-dependent hydrolase
MVRPWIALLALAAVGICLSGADPPTAQVASRAAGVGGTARPAPVSQPTTQFVIATYNIYFGNTNLPGVVEAIRKSQADLVCLQETNRQSEAFLRRQLGGQYKHMVFQNAPAAGGFGFLSVLPLREVRYYPRKHGPFGMFTARVKLAGVETCVTNLHLMPVMPQPNRNVLAVLLESEGVRAREIEYFRGLLPPKMPLILAGDLNSISSMSAPTFLRNNGLVDSFASVTPEPDGHITWQGTHTGRSWKHRIDYIFHSGEFRTAASRVLQMAGSDHYAVVSTLAAGGTAATATVTAPAKQGKGAGAPAGKVAQ